MKRMILALALGMLIGSASTALAAPEIISATVANFKILVNGEEKQLSAPPILVNGSTYVPLRAAGELVGAEVDFADNTIMLTTGPVAETTPPEGDENGVNETVEPVTLTEQEIQAIKESDEWMPITSLLKHGVQGAVVADQSLSLYDGDGTRIDLALPSEHAVFIKQDGAYVRKSMIEESFNIDLQ